MTRALLLAVVVTLLTACSYESRQFWGTALQGAGAQVGSSRTTYCTTWYRHGVASTSCY